MSKSYSRPIHPATVPFSIAFLYSSQALDIAHFLTSSPTTTEYATSIYNLTPYLSDIARLSAWLNTVGLVFAVPAVMTGLLEFLALAKRQGLISSGTGKIKKKGMSITVQMALMHSFLMNLTLAAAGYNWWTRDAANVSTTNALVSALAMPVFGLAGLVGYTMVYVCGVGVSASGGFAKKDD